MKRSFGNALGQLFTFLLKRKYLHTKHLKLLLFLYFIAIKSKKHFSPNETTVISMCMEGKYLPKNCDFDWQNLGTTLTWLNIVLVGQANRVREA
jgi:hypothetical protein